MKHLLSIIHLLLFMSSGWTYAHLPILIHPPALSPSHPTMVDLLTGTLQNTHNDSYRIRLKAVVTRNGIPTAVATSAAFVLNPGTLPIHSGNAPQLLTPVDEDYYIPEMRASVERTGALPPGSYMICIYALEEYTRDTLGITCYDHAVMDLNPPMLVLPMDGEEVTNPFPTFVWTPPSPLPDMPDYRLRIAPLMGNQSPVVAMGSNTAFHDVDGLGTTLYQYPVSARQFDPGMQYAWQVAVYQQGALVTQSEIFTFRAGSGGGGNASDASASLDKVIMIVALDDRDTLIERVPKGLRFYKEQGRLTFSEETFFTVPVKVQVMMDVERRELSQRIFFERVPGGLGYALRLVASGNYAGQEYEYLTYVTPGGKVLNYKFRN
jgi:hypothetical protein